MMKSPWVKIGAILATGFGGVGLPYSLILAVIFIAACSGGVFAQETQRIPGQRPPQMGSVAGTIRDENGPAIAAVSVGVRHHRFAFSPTTHAEGVSPVNKLLVGGHEIFSPREGFAASTTDPKVSPAHIADSPFS